MERSLSELMTEYKRRFGELPQIGVRMSREEFSQRIAAAMERGEPDPHLDLSPYETDGERTAIGD